MSFIYSRAQKVVAWLGVREFSDRNSLTRIMSAEWKNGVSHQLAPALAEGTKLHRSAPPDRGTLYRVARSAYWTRLWIVQEACLAYSLLIVFGAKVWAFDEMEGWSVWKAVVSESPGGRNVPGFGAMLQLAQARSSKFTDDMKFERLVERFAKQACTDRRDRVYGLLGLANDVHAFVVDYDRSFYDIWKDAVKFVFFRARAMEGSWHPRPETNPVLQNVSAILEQERRISLMRTAGIIQAALDGRVGEELKLSKNAGRLVNPNGENGQLQDSEGLVIRAIGYLAGQIVQLGPEYTSLMGSFRAQQDWLDSWEESYSLPADFEVLRKTNEDYMARLVDFGDEELRQIRELRHPDTIAWFADGGIRPLRSSRRSHEENNENRQSKDGESDNHSPKDPRICLGTNHIISLVPSEARIGDFIVRFWNCDAAIVVRPSCPGPWHSNSLPPYFNVVGKADVAKARNEKDQAAPGRDITAESSLALSPNIFYERDVTRPTAPGNGTENFIMPQGAVYVDMDFPTLQHISEHISTP
ncbi:hypothetical protein MFIFM68171_02665 [Madurella fahalii]|uniref:Heterokaryon incompatibility domain-containing protein n=1 Tax=Madurella fahalii TaxID=1157608 RepID=A0ABQ0G3V9_9PEZI